MYFYSVFLFLLHFSYSFLFHFFFIFPHPGEVALFDPSNKRSANVIAFDKVKCMTLTKADFGFLLKGVRSVMVQVQKTRIITDQQALGKSKIGTSEF